MRKFLNSFSAKQKVKIGIFAGVILLIVLFLFILYLRGDLKFRADVAQEGLAPYENQASLSYTDSLGNPREIQSNIVQLTVGDTIDSIVSGSVKDKNGDPLYGITVSLCKWSSNNFLGSCLKAVNDRVTDSNGNYYIYESLEEGAYLVMFSPYQEYGPTSLMRDLHPFYIYPDQSYIYNLTLREWPIVDGRIFYDGWKKQFNSPRMLSEVNCALKDGENTIFEKMSDENGNFRIYSDDNVPDGTYSVVCTKDNYLAKKGYTAKADNPTVTVSGSEYDWTLVNMIDDIPDPARINLSVLDGTGQPIRSIRIKVTFNETNQSKKWSITSGTTSQRIIPLSHKPGLPDGSYTITASTYTGYISSVQNITLSPNETKDLSFTLQPSAAITGTIKSTESDPIYKSGRYPLVIELLNSDGTQVLKTYRKLYSTTDGYSYKFLSDITPATYKIRASAGYHMNKTEDIVINSSSDKPVVDITLGPGCSFGGNVRDASGEAVTFAKVELLDTGDNLLAEFTTGKAGLLLYSYWQQDEYEFGRNINTGSYKIKVSAYGYEPQSQNVSCAALGEKVKNINFVLGASPQEASNLALVESTTSSDEIIKAEIFRETQVIDQSPSDEDVQMLETEYDVEGNIIENQEAGSYLYVEGIVIDQKNKKPIENAKVTLLDNKEIVASAMTNIDGDYHLASDKIEANKNYTLKVGKIGSKTDKQEISLKDKDNKYDFELKRQNFLISFFQTIWEWIKNLFK